LSCPPVPCCPALWPCSAWPGCPAPTAQRPLPCTLLPCCPAQRPSAQRPAPVRPAPPGVPPPRPGVPFVPPATGREPGSGGRDSSPPYTICPVRKFLSKNHSVGFCPKKTPGRKHPPPDVTGPKFYKQKSGLGPWRRWAGAVAASGRLGMVPADPWPRRKATHAYPWVPPSVALVGL